MHGIRKQKSVDLTAISMVMRYSHCRVFQLDRERYICFSVQ